MIEGRENLKTALSDDSALYAKADTRSMKEKWKDLDTAGKIQFFKDYILLKVIAAIAIVGVVIYTLVQILTPKPEIILSVAVIDDPYREAQTNLIENDLKALLVEDEEKYEVDVDTSFYYRTDEANSRMKMAAVLSAGEIDAIILPKSEFQNLVNAEACMNLEEFLPEELKNRARSLFELATYVPDAVLEDKNTYYPTPYAINLDPYYEQLFDVRPDTSYYLVCIVNSKHRDTTLSFVEYMLDSMKR